MRGLVRGTSLVWLLFVGNGCATAAPVRSAGSDVDTLPACSSPVLGLVPEALDGKDPEAVRRELVQLGLLADSDSVRVVPVSAKPEFRTSRIEVVRILERNYPPALKSRGQGGRVELAVLIDSIGAVRRAEVAESSGHVELDAAARKSMMQIQFYPATYGGCRTMSWLMLPVSMMTH